MVKLTIRTIFPLKNKQTKRTKNDIVLFTSYARLTYSVSIFPHEHISHNNDFTKSAQEYIFYQRKDGMSIQNT